VVRQSREGRPPDGKRPRVYWDSWVIIEWLKDTKDPGVEEQVRRMRAGEVAVVTSAITLVEVLECTIPEERKILLRSLGQMPNKLEIVALGQKEAERAHEIRNHYKEADPEEAKTVATQDAVHLATANLRECEVFYTGDGESSRRSGRCLKLIPLSGDGGVYGMRIERPPAPPAPPPPSPPEQVSLLSEEPTE
jgi:hypothetical protein